MLPARAGILPKTVWGSIGDRVRGWSWLRPWSISGGVTRQPDGARRCSSSPRVGGEGVGSSSEQAGGKVSSASLVYD